MSTTALLALLLLMFSLSLSFIGDIMKAMGTSKDHPILTVVVGFPLGAAILGVGYGAYYLVAWALLALIGILA